MSRVVFVGNVPYDVEEDKLIPVFSTVGPIAGFRLMVDKETGKSKGYAFCEYHDHDTAASAVRNLNGTEVSGRPLRIDLADSDPFFEGKTTKSGRTRPDDDNNNSRPTRFGAAEDKHVDPLANLPKGIPIPPGSDALTTITTSLAAVPPAQMLDILGQMKAYVISSPEHARLLFNAHPQLAYAFFQAMVLNNLVDPAILERMITAAAAQAPPPAPAPVQAPPMPSHPVPVQPAAYRSAPTAPLHPQQPYYAAQKAPVPTPYAQPNQAVYPPPQAPPRSAPPPVQQQPDIPEEQKAMLMQILSLSQEQINALPPQERTTVQQLRAQFMGTG
ncbi:hypothetical protein FRB97_002933 [Tulasnella sp. 331]|nr:hypothetical protein FRB97_002933 [Tulasnella sp. 331]